MLKRDQLIIQYYTYGLSYKKVADKVGCAEGTVGRVLKKYNIKTRSLNAAWINRGAKVLDHGEVIRRYGTGDSVLSLSRYYGVSRNKINLILSDANISRRTMVEQRNLRPTIVDNIDTDKTDSFSYTDIMTAYDVSRSTARKIRQRNGIVGIVDDNTIDIDLNELVDLHVNKNISVTKLAKQYGCYYGTIVNKLGEHYSPYSGNSGLNTDFSEFLTLLNVPYQTNCRKIISPWELDFFIPDHNIAIELNGLYWHTELSGRKERSYHFNKMKLCAESNIKLMFITDEEWYGKPEICKSMVMHKLGLSTTVYARKCNVIYVSNYIGKKFFERNHISGHAKAAKYIGLELNGNLVSCLSLAKPRFSNEADYEIIRFANVLNHTVVGGFSRMLKQIDGSILTFSDRMYGDGGVYKNNGFSFVHHTQCGYKYVKNNKTFNRLNFQKHKLKCCLETFDPSLSEWENMKLNGYDRIWDCGHSKWIRN